MKSLGYKDLSSIEMQRFKDDYKAIFKDYLNDKKDKNGSVVVQMETKWLDWKRYNDPHKTIPESVEELLVMDYVGLVDVYRRFKALGIPEKVKGSKNLVRNPILVTLDEIFKYTNSFDSKIAQFFHDRAKLLRIHTCYYCEMAYVNTYERVDHMGKLDKRRHFDLDHFLPRSKCPCIGLSLFNFVPSCQVCNSRIKHDFLPSDIYDELKLLSPSSIDSDFKNNVTIRLRIRPHKDKLLGDRYIYFRAKPPYHKFVRFFHLEERYEFHKTEALRLKNLKANYPHSNIKKIARLLKRCEAAVREDIFQTKFLRQEGRCFEKLTSDILGS